MNDETVLNTDTHIHYTYILNKDLKKIKVKVCIAVHVNPCQSYGASPAVWDNTVLPDT